jgi:hypothetical protein
VSKDEFLLVLKLCGMENQAKTQLLAYSPETHKSVQTFSANLEAPYLVPRWEQVHEQLDLSQLSIDVVLALSKSRTPDLGE